MVSDVDNSELGDEDAGGATVMDSRSGDRLLDLMGTRRDRWLLLIPPRIGAAGRACRRETRLDGAIARVCRRGE